MSRRLISILIRRGVPSLCQIASMLFLIKELARPNHKANNLFLPSAFLFRVLANTSHIKFVGAFWMPTFVSGPGFIFGRFKLVFTFEDLINPQKHKVRIFFIFFFIVVVDTILNFLNCLPLKDTFYIFGRAWSMRLNKGKIKITWPFLAKTKFRHLSFVWGRGIFLQGKTTVLEILSELKHFLWSSYTLLSLYFNSFRWLSLLFTGSLWFLLSLNLIFTAR